MTVHRLRPLPNGSRGIMLALYLDLETPVDYGEDPDRATPENIERWQREHAAMVDRWFTTMGDETRFLVSSAIAPTLLNILDGGGSPEWLISVSASDVLASDVLASADVLARAIDRLPGAP